MAVSSQIVESMKNSSWIRKMFEAGAELAAKYGAENVFDFTLGNPNIEPPAEFEETLIKSTVKISSIKRNCDAIHYVVSNHSIPQKKCLSL